MKRSTSQSSCPLTTSSERRRTSDQQTDAIKAAFPPGVGKPALRALLAAGLTKLENLRQVSEPELAAMHGMGPKAIAALRGALVARGWDFRR